MKKQSRAARKELRKEEKLNSRTEWGVCDPVPKKAVDIIISRNK